MTNDDSNRVRRRAILAAHGADGPDTITFDLAGCSCVIGLVSGQSR